MKTLFLSLLRTGDFIMHRNLLETALKSSEVHVLVNDEFHQLRDMYPMFTFHFFPRRELQNLVNQPQTSLLAPFRQLRNFMNNLNQENFQEVINLTHNRISAYLMDQIHAPLKKGLEFHEEGFRPFTTPWQKLFNIQFSGSERSDLHYLAGLSKCLDIERPPLSIVEDREDKTTVFFQVFTSDSKKNWDLSNWKWLAQRLHQSLPHLQVRIFASEKEVPLLLPHFSQEQILVCRLDQAREELRNARLLISGDTSMAHLAAETKTPSLTLCLGSSDYTKTLPWIHGAWALTSEVSCAPCPHSSPCLQAEHLCGQTLRASIVLDVTMGLLKDKRTFTIPFPLRLVRQEADLKIGLKPKTMTNTEREYEQGSEHSNVL